MLRYAVGGGFFAFWPVFPAAVDLEILLWIAADDAFQCGGVFLRDPE